MTIVTLAVGLFVNVPYQARVIATATSGKFTFSQNNVHGLGDSVSIHAGWPLNYLQASVQSQSETDHRLTVNLDRSAVGHLWTSHVGRSPSDPAVRVRVTRSSTLGFLFNLVVVGLIAAVLAVLAHFRGAPAGGRAGAVSRRWVCDALSLAVIALAIGWSGWVTWDQSRIHRRMARALGGRGSVELVTRVPAIIAPRVPPAVAGVLMRIETVLLRKPTGVQLIDVGQLPSLRRLTLVQHNIGGQTVDRWVNQKSLTELRLIYCRMTESSVGSLARCESLERLSMYHCELPPGRPGHVRGLPSLRTLRLYNTAVGWDPETLPAWTRSVQSFASSGPERLSRRGPGGGEDYGRDPDADPDEELSAAGMRGGTAPPADDSDMRLSITGWPQLRHVELLAAPRVNPRPLGLTLVDLPRLIDVQLSRWRQVSLVAARLPRLERIGEVPGISGSEFTAPRNLPNGLWVDRLTLAELPQLREVAFSANDLRHLSLRQLPSVRRLTLQRGYFSNELIAPKMYPVEAINPEWIRQISELTSLQELRLGGMRLRDFDLTSLTRLTDLRSLELVGSELRSEDIDFVHRFTDLRVLQVPGCRLRGDRLNRLIVDLPRLTTLDADLRGLPDLMLQDHAAIRDIGRLELPSARRVRLAGVPRLGGSLWLRGTVERLDLSQPTRLSGLWLDQPWPEDADLRGLRHLRQFAGRGPHLDDRILAQLLRCGDLDELTVAYGSLSEAALRSIRQLNHLTQLRLPGAAIDDDSTAAWAAMTRLRDVNFDDTGIGAATLRWLARQPSLRQLSLAGLDLRGPAGEALAELRQVASLSLARTRIDPPIYDRLAENHFLERLDVSGIPHEDSIWRALSRSTSLRLITIDSPPPVELTTQWMTEKKKLVFQFAHGVSSVLIDEFRDRMPVELADRIRPPASTGQLSKFGGASWPQPLALR